ncbi:MAG TPA: hypothetical protein VHL11_09850 [Phototrophicaceae bacterium]|jgi:hypothetical protein|nr:hypothetical protein [Phototrophicaceae bacterium]
MPTVKFSRIPTEVELLAVSRQIDRSIAEQILHYSNEWGGTDLERQIEIINTLTDLVDTLGKHCWQDIVWSQLMSRINNLSTDINQKVKKISTGKLARH